MLTRRVVLGGALLAAACARKSGPRSDADIRRFLQERCGLLEARFRAIPEIYKPAGLDEALKTMTAVVSRPDGIELNDTLLSPMKAVSFPPFKLIVNRQMVAGMGEWMLEAIQAHETAHFAPRQVKEAPDLEALTARFGTLPKLTPEVLDTLRGDPQACLDLQRYAGLYLRHEFEGSDLEFAVLAAQPRSPGSSLADHLREVARTGGNDLYGPILQGKARQIETGMGERDQRLYLRQWMFDASLSDRLGEGLQICAQHEGVRGEPSFRAWVQRFLEARVPIS